jgi:hypothetical protein
VQNSILWDNKELHAEYIDLLTGKSKIWLGKEHVCTYKNWSGWLCYNVYNGVNENVM